jgi:hypothetical protein
LLMLRRRCGELSAEPQGFQGGDVGDSQF